MSLNTASALARADNRLDAAAWYAIIAGMSGSFVGIGLARFAYTPLLPSLIEAHWFTADAAVTLGAANFVGYLIGALLGRPLAAVMPSRHLLRLLMVAATAAFFACAYPLSASWYFVWRFLSGLSGGAIMVLVATSILPHIPPARRGFASGMIFLGLGLGIAASGTVVPLLLRLGLWESWMGLGALSLVLSAISWFGWPAAATPTAASAGAPQGTTGLRALYVAYALNALGLVPGMLLLVDFIARGLDQGADVGAQYWVLYGAAAIVGPLLCGSAGDRIGFRRAYRLALLLQAVAVAILAATSNPAWVAVSTVILGIFTPGVVPLLLGSIHEVLPGHLEAQRAAWSVATTAFALFQALAGYGYSTLFAFSGGNYALIFACGSAALAVAFLAALKR